VSIGVALVPAFRSVAKFVHMLVKITGRHGQLKLGFRKFRRSLGARRPRRYKQWAERSETTFGGSPGHGS
jgi:hypothetical protein